MRIKYFIPVETFLKIFLAVILLIVGIRYFQARLHLSDLKVYYGALRKLLGLTLDPALFGQDILNLTDRNPYHFYYGLNDGNYKYAPFFFLVFFIFAFFPWKLLLFLFPLLNCTGFYFLVKGIKKLLVDNFLKQNSNENLLDIALILVVILQSHNIYREILIGNINIFLMLCLVYFLIYELKNKLFTASFFLSLLILIKPHFVFVFMLLVLYRKIKLTLFTSLLSLLFMCSPVLFWGYGTTVQFIFDWIHAMQLHNDTQIYLSSRLNIQSILWKFYSALGMEPTFIHKSFYVNAVIIAVLGPLFFLAALIKQWFPQGENKNFILFAFLFSAIIPFVLLVDTNQLLYIFPFAVFLFYEAILNLKARLNKFYQIIFIGIYILTILTQQIPADWSILGNFIGLSYLLLLLYSAHLSLWAARGVQGT